MSGIGQAAKFPHYTKGNTFNGLHGRALPVATGIRLANHEMPVIVTTGDGDCYGEGGNHLMAAIRRNVNIKLFVHDNQIYGLTKGQPSPTTGEGMVTKNVPFGVISGQFNPLALAVALDCSFAARSFAGDIEHLKGMMKAGDQPQGIRTRGHPAALRVLQQGEHVRLVPPAGLQASARNTIRRTGKARSQWHWSGATAFPSASSIGTTGRPSRNAFRSSSGKPLVKQEQFDREKLERTLAGFQ